MAKKTEAKRGRGRPPADDPLAERVMCRMDKETKAALDRYVSQTGLGSASTAMRVIVVDRLRKEGLLK